MSYVSDVVGIAANLLTGAGGLQANMDALAAAEGIPRVTIAERQVVRQNAPAEIVEKSGAASYPCIQVYCEKVTNDLQERFRSFAGTVQLAIEVRVSSDRLECLDTSLNLVTGGVVGTLDQNRGDWGAGIFFGGAYTIAYGPVKHGGRNFLQTAKVTFSLDVSRA